MPDQRKIITGSEHAAPRGMRTAGRVPADRIVTVSVYFRPAPDEEAGAVTADGGLNPRAALREARDVGQAGNIAAVQAFANQASLTVAETDATRRLVKLSGSVSALEGAFGTQLHI